MKEKIKDVISTIIFLTFLFPFAADGKDFYPKIFADIAKEARKSVVLIYNGLNFSSDEPVIQSIGTGFFADENGWIITARHVVETFPELMVRVETGDLCRAKIVAKHPNANVDLAIIKLEGKIPANIHPLKTGDSSKVEAGDMVIAIGHPTGLYWSVSAGIISALRKSEEIDFFQTDTAINPGNSGGPLINTDGEVIGVVIMMAQGANCISFAISIAAGIDFIRQTFEILNSPLR